MVAFAHVVVASPSIENGHRIWFVTHSSACARAWDSVNGLLSEQPPQGMRSFCSNVMKSRFGFGSDQIPMRHCGHFLLSPEFISSAQVCQSSICTHHVTTHICYIPKHPAQMECTFGQINTGDEDSPLCPLNSCMQSWHL